MSNFIVQFHLATLNKVWSEKPCRFHVTSVSSNIAALFLHNQYVSIGKHLSDKDNYPTLWPIRLVFSNVSYQIIRR